MKKIKIEHKLDCSVERFWQVFFDADFNRAFYRERMQFPVYEITHQATDGDRVTRTVEVRPKTNMPRAVAKRFGDGLVLQEEGSFDPASGTWRFTMTPSVMADKVRSGGTIRCATMGDDRCHRVVELEIEARVFGLGGIMESGIERSQRENWAKMAQFMGQWLAERPAPS